MPRTPTLRYDRGTLILHPPPKGKAWVDYVTWDDRIEKFRMPASAYWSFLLAMRNEGVGIEDKAKAFEELFLEPTLTLKPYPHQLEARDA